jgi:hypothetical protein
MDTNQHAKVMLDNRFSFEIDLDNPAHLPGNGASMLS